ncbi:MAG: hypothetical protein J0651_04155 [Actinobacteria bacterium]|nr:hypothetical protein [Actinomycetota bacterium]
MLLQSWGDRIRIFPAIPLDWENVVFHDLRTEGAFLVSAERLNGKTLWVKIRSLAGAPCLIKPGFTGPFTFSSPSSLSITKKEVESGLFELNLKKGEEVILYQSSR